MVDLCVGPHVPHTGRIKAFSVLKVCLVIMTFTSILTVRFQSSASYFLGDQNNDSLQRVYGISFPDAKQLTEYKAFLAEAAKRDHRKIGKVRVDGELRHVTCSSDIRKHKRIGTGTVLLP